MRRPPCCQEQQTPAGRPPAALQPVLPPSCLPRMVNSSRAAPSTSAACAAPNLPLKTARASWVATGRPAAWPGSILLPCGANASWATTASSGPALSAVGTAAAAAAARPAFALPASLAFLRRLQCTGQCFWTLRYHSKRATCSAAKCSWGDLTYGLEPGTMPGISSRQAD